MNKMEESKSHLQIFNNIWNSPRKESGFTCFPLLPTELRLKIWRCSLQRERIIRVHFFHARASADYYAPFNLHGRDMQYFVAVEGRRALSKLLLVNQEARQTALRFYRVHFPCTLQDDRTGKMQEKATFCFNPEYDFLQIQPRFCGEEKLFDFFYHLKITYDPRRVGLLNLAIEGADTLQTTGLYSLNPADVRAELRESFLETIAHLREVFFVQNVIEGRQVLGSWSRIPLDDFLLNRSMPIATSMPTFNRLHRDPRPVSDDLKQTYIGPGPLNLFGFWQQLLDKWDVSPTQIKYQYVLSFLPIASNRLCIHDKESAKNWLQKEEYEWTGQWRVDNYDSDNDEEGFWGIRTTSDGRPYKYPVGALHERYRHEDLEKAVKPAFGFWLFPVFPDEFGKMPSFYGDLHPSSEGLWDLSRTWPGIGLTDLP